MTGDILQQLMLRRDAQQQVLRLCQSLYNRCDSGMSQFIIDQRELEMWLAKVKLAECEVDLAREAVEQQGEQ
jgi:hypothetical protein